MSETRLSDAEWKVMTAVWDGAPATARHVLEALEADTGWAYSTIKTMLDRLVEKGVLEGTLKGITTHYTPLISRDDARRAAAGALAERAFDGEVSSMLAFLVSNEKLSKKEREALRAMLEQRRGRRR